MYTNFNFSVFNETLTNLHYFYDLIISNIEITFIFEITILGTTIFMANRLGDKILKGLQGGAAITILTRGICDAITKFGGENENEKDNKNKDSKTETEKGNLSNNSDSNNSYSNNSDSNNSNSNKSDSNNSDNNSSNNSDNKNGK